MGGRICGQSPPASHGGPGPGPTVLLTFLASLAVAIASWYVIDRQVMARPTTGTRPARGRTAMIVAYSLLDHRPDRWWNDPGDGG